MCLHKEAVAAIAQTKVESLIENFENNDAVLFSKLIELRKSPLPVLVEEIRKLDTFKDIMQHIVSAIGTESQLNMTYLKNVPTMLAIVSAVRESDLKRNFSAKQKFLKLMFAFDHINYARYNTYHHVYLKNLLRKDKSIAKDLITNWYGASSSGTAQKMKFSIKDFFSKCDQLRSKLRVWSPLLKKSLMEPLNFCAVWALIQYHPRIFRD